MDAVFAPHVWAGGRVDDHNGMDSEAEAEEAEAEEDG